MDHDRAACIGMTDIFYSPLKRDLARAKSLCAECFMRSACLTGASERHEPNGVWGGVEFGSRRAAAA